MSFRFELLQDISWHRTYRNGQLSRVLWAAPPRRPNGRIPSAAAESVRNAGSLRPAAVDGLSPKPLNVHHRESRIVVLHFSVPQ